VNEEAIAHWGADAPKTNKQTSISTLNTHKYAVHGSRTHSKVRQGRRTCPGLLLKATSQVGLHHLHSVAASSPDSKIHSLIEVSVKGEIKIAFEMISAALEIMFNFTLM